MSTHQTDATIAVTLGTNAELKALRFAIRGQLNAEATADAYDDELVAVVLGWHLRRLDGDLPSMRKFAMLNLLWRQTKLLRQNSAAPIHPLHLLTVNGINPGTLTDIESRVARVHNLLIAVRDLPEFVSVGERHDEIVKHLKSASDQLSIDLLVWVIARPSDPIGVELIEYPRHVVDEIRARADRFAQAS